MSKGLSMPTSDGAGLHQRRARCPSGARTLSTRSEPKAPAGSVISAPAAAIGLVGDAGGHAGARLHEHRVPWAISFLAVSGVTATRVSPGRFGGYADLHGRSPSFVVLLRATRPARAARRSGVSRIATLRESRAPSALPGRARSLALRMSPAAGNPASPSPPSSSATAASCWSRKHTPDGLRLNKPAGHLDPGESLVAGRGARGARRDRASTSRPTRAGRRLHVARHPSRGRRARGRDLPALRLLRHARASRSRAARSTTASCARCG